MKPILFALPLALLSFAAFSQSPQCLSDICQGDSVIDSYNNTGSVIGIDSQNGYVVFRKDGYSSYSNARPSELAKKIASSRFPENKVVIDSYNNVGKVIAVYSNGAQAYRKDGYSSTSFTRDLSPEVEVLDDLTKGKKMLDSYNNQGSIVFLFENRVVGYKKDGYSSTSFTNSSSVSPEVASVNGLSINMNAIDSYNNIGKVRSVFKDGRVAYQKDGYSSTSISNSLVPEVSAINNISTNTIVVDSYNNIGRAGRVFRDGRIEYRKDGYSSSSVSNSLSYRVNETSSGIRSDMNVIDSYNNIGRVIYAFNDGRVAYKKEGYSSSSISSTLYKEVDTHAKYDKDSRYSTASNFVGKPNRFFENGAIEIKSATSKQIAQELFAEVAELDGLTVGSEVLNSKEEKIAVTALFANDTALYNKKIEGVDTEMTGRLVSLQQIENENKEAAHSWIKSIMQDIQQKDDDIYFSSLRALPLVAEANLATLKGKALEAINDGYSISDKKLRKEIVSRLENGVVQKVPSQEPTPSVNTDPTTTTVPSPTEVIKNVLQLKVNKDKHLKSITRALEARNIPYFVVKKVSDSAPNFLDIEIKDGLFKKSCIVKIMRNNSRNTSILETNSGDIASECLAKIEEVLDTNF